MAEARLRILSQGARRAARDMGRLGTAIGKGIGGAVGTVQGDIRRLTGGLGGLASAMGVAFGAREVLTFSAKLGALQAKTRASTADMMKLKQSILGAASVTGVSKDELADFVTEMQDFGGLAPEAQKKLGDIAKVMRGAGVAGSEMGRTFGTLIQKGFKTGEAVDAIGKIIKSADAGTVSFANLSRIAGQMFGVFAEGGFTGARGLEQMNIAIQTVGARFSGSAEETRTSISALFRDLQANAKVISKIVGFEIVDKDKNLKDIDVIAKALFKKLGPGAALKLKEKKGATRVTAETVAALGAYEQAFDFKTGEYKKTGKQATVESVRAASKAGGAADIESMFKARNEGIDAAGAKLQQSINRISEIFQNFGGKMLTGIVENPGKAAGMAAGGYALSKLMGPLMRMIAGKRGGKVGALLGAAGAKGAPVFVTNMPAGLGGGGIPGVTGGGGGGFLPSKLAGLSKLGKFASVAGGLTAAASAGYALGTAFDELTGSSDAISAGLFELINNGGRVTEKQASENERESAKGMLKYKAEQLANLARSGVTKFGARGDMQELTQKTAMENLAKQAASHGLTQEEFKQMLPTLKLMLKELKKPPVVIGSPGIDKPSVVQATGPATS